MRLIFEMFFFALLTLNFVNAGWKEKKLRIILFFYLLTIKVLQVSLLESLALVIETFEIT